MELDNLKYNYVICGSTEGYYDFGYHDIMELKSVNYYHTYDECVNTKLEKLLIRLNFSRKINRFIKTPFAKFVYPRIYRPKFENNNPICFLFFGNTEYVFQTSFLEYIRENYPNSKIVLFMQDLIRRNTRLDFAAWRDSFDLILSYDKGDCDKYNLHFHPTPMSELEVVEDSGLEHSDIFFCGYAKNRYAQIHEFYEKFTSLGLKCDFHIMQFPEGEKQISGIHYDVHNLTYEQNIQHVLKSKCILEIMQEGADGYTPRVWESIIYDRHLISNNIMLKSAEFYNPSYMHMVDEVSSAGILDLPVQYTSSEKRYLSPTHLLTYIDNLLLSL